jgi:hypothetical protein
LFGPRVRVSDDPTERSYVIDLTMTIVNMQHLARLTTGELSTLVERLSMARKPGRPW